MLLYSIMLLCVNNVMYVGENSKTYTRLGVEQTFLLCHVYLTPDTDTYPRHVLYLDA